MMILLKQFTIVIILMFPLILFAQTDQHNIRNIFASNSANTLASSQKQLIKKNITPLKTQLIPIHFLTATNLQQLLSNTKLGLLSQQGYISVEKEQNLLFIHDHPSNIKRIKKMIAQLDHQQQQIFIKAHIINIDQRYLNSLGVVFSTGHNDVKTADGLNMNLPSNNQIETAIIPIA